MKIWIGTRYIDTSYFRTWCLNEDLQMVYFIHQPKEGFDGEFSLPLLFSSLEEAKRFYDESWNAIADGADAMWCLDEHTQQLKLKSAKNKKHKSQKNEADVNSRNNTDGTVPGDNVPRTTWYHNLLVRLRLRRG